MHPPLTQPTCTLRSVARPGPIVSLSLGPRWRAVSQAVCCAPCYPPYRRAGCRVARPLRHIVALPTPYRGASPGRVVPVSRHTQQHSLTRLSQYTHSYHDTIPQRLGPCARAAYLACKPALSWPVSTISWSCPRPYRGLVRPYRGPCCLSMHACCAPCVTIQCTVS